MAARLHALSLFAPIQRNVSFHSLVLGWVAMLFILFDLEIVFMYPWAVVYKEMIVESKLIFWSMLSFISILMVGYVYALKKGALDWKK